MAGSDGSSPGRGSFAVFVPSKEKFKSAQPILSSSSPVHQFTASIAPTKKKFRSLTLTKNSSNFFLASGSVPLRSALIPISSASASLGFCCFLFSMYSSLHVSFCLGLFSLSLPFQAHACTVFCFFFCLRLACRLILAQRLRIEIGLACHLARCYC